MNDRCIHALIVLIVSYAADWVWAAYIMHTSNGRIISASLYSGVIILMGAFVTKSYIEDTTMIVPAVIGGMLGTAMSVKQNR